MDGTYEHTINNCVNNGVITGEKQFVGGIVGRGNTWTINECINTGIVNGKSQAIGGIAGIVGWNK